MPQRCSARVRAPFRRTQGYDNRPPPPHDRGEKKADCKTTQIVPSGPGSRCRRHPVPVVLSPASRSTPSRAAGLTSDGYGTGNWGNGSRRTCGGLPYRDTAAKDLTKTRRPTPVVPARQSVSRGTTARTINEMAARSRASARFLRIRFGPPIANRASLPGEIRSAGFRDDRAGGDEPGTPWTLQFHLRHPMRLMESPPCIFSKFSILFGVLGPGGLLLLLGMLRIAGRLPQKRQREAALEKAFERKRQSNVDNR